MKHNKNETTQIPDTEEVPKYGLKPVPTAHDQIVPELAQSGPGLNTIRI